MDPTLSRQTTFASLASQVLAFPEDTSEEPEKTTQELDTQETAQQEPSTPTQPQNGATLPTTVQPASSPVAGLRTTKAYYTPLAHIAAQVNRQKSLAFDDTSLDILAVAVSAPTKAKRAKDGPRNHFTTLRVTQPGLHPRTMGVTLFRGKQSALPRVSKGEVVLMSGLSAVALNGGGVGLQSGEGAAWCVWRREKQRGKEVAWVEEVKGPAVEVGEDERAEVLKLREWWRGL